MIVPYNILTASSIWNNKTVCEDGDLIEFVFIRGTPDPLWQAADLKDSPWTVWEVLQPEEYHYQRDNND